MTKESQAVGAFDRQAAAFERFHVKNVRAGAIPADLAAEKIASRLAANSGSPVNRSTELGRIDFQA